MKDRAANKNKLKEEGNERRRLKSANSTMNVEQTLTKNKQQE